MEVKTSVAKKHNILLNGYDKIKWVIKYLPTVLIAGHESVSQTDVYTLLFRPEMP